MVPYFQKGNLVFLSSYATGTLGFMDILGKITVIDVFEKRQIFEEAEIVRNLLVQLTTEWLMEKNIVREKEDKTLLYYVSLFYLRDKSIFIEATHVDDTIDASIF